MKKKRYNHGETNLDEPLQVMGAVYFGNYCFRNSWISNWRKSLVRFGFHHYPNRLDMETQKAAKGVQTVDLLAIQMQTWYLSFYGICFNFTHNCYLNTLHNSPCVLHAFVTLDRYCVKKQDSKSEMGGGVWRRCGNERTHFHYLYELSGNTPCLLHGALIIYHQHREVSCFGRF